MASVLQKQYRGLARLGEFLNLQTEAQMVETLGITRESFQGYLDANVFAPAIHSKRRGRPSKNKNSGALYDADTVLKEVADFQKGKFSPVAVIGPQSEAEAIGVSADKAGQVIQIHGRGEKEEPFDPSIVGDISTIKLLSKAIEKVALMPEVPVKVKKDLQRLYEMKCKARERRDNQKKKITVEKHEADLQKIHSTWAKAWSGALGLEAAQDILQEFERALGKSILRENSNAVQIIHRAIVKVSDGKIQPDVIRILEKL